jgi:hypothetical protein
MYVFISVISGASRWQQTCIAAFGSSWVAINQPEPTHTLGHTYLGRAWR